MQISESDDLPGESDSSAVSSSNGNISAFRESVDGSYVGSYRDQDQAERQAKGLSQRGWPAYVEEGRVQDVVWHRVYLRPQNSGQGGGQTHLVEIVADVSRTVPQLELGQPIPELCLGLTKFQVLMSVLRKLATVTSGRKVNMALRSTGFERFARESLYSNLLWGPGPYREGGLSPALETLGPSRSFAPLDYAIAAADDEFSARPGTKHLVMVSDFMVMEGFGSPLNRALELKHKYGPDLCLTTIYVGADNQGVRLARDMAQFGECGNVYDGCLLLSDQAYFDTLVRNVFFGLASGLSDADGDGVPDGQDLCPDTSRGATVDERGCWVAAFAQYFDFNSDVIKQQYVANLSQVADVIKADSKRSVTIAGHTDNVGTPEYNTALGRRRAQAVKRILEKFGVAPARLKVKSYGESKPKADNGSPEGRARNRRVEIEGL
jgi:OOP family OmpA-OmpF porin